MSIMCILLLQNCCTKTGKLTADLFEALYFSLPDAPKSAIPLYIYASNNVLHR